VGGWILRLLLAITVLIAAALVIPSLIDWTEFRPAIEAEASRLVGRPVKITGAIELQLLWRPAVKLGGLRIGDPKRPSEPLLAAGRLEAVAAWLPLISGRLEIAQLRLSDATVRVHINWDGGGNWDLPKPSARTGAPDTSILSPRDFAPALAFILPQHLALSDIIVDRSTILYTDERTSADDRIEKISGRFSFPGLLGPFVGNAGFEISHVPLSLGFSVDAIAPGRPTPMLLKFGILDAGGTLTIKGAAAGLDAAVAAARLDPATFTGTLALSARASAPLIKGLGALLEFGSDPQSRARSLGWSRLRSLPVALAGTLTRDLQTSKLVAAGNIGSSKFDLGFIRGRHDRRLDLVAASDLIDLSELIDLDRAGGMRRHGQNRGQGAEIRRGRPRRSRHRGQARAGWRGLDRRPYHAARPCAIVRNRTIAAPRQAGLGAL
jgi:hypothetical protein